MTKNLLTFKTMKNIIDIPENISIQGLLQKLSECTELHRPLRRYEKRELMEANDFGRFQLGKKIVNSQDKAFVLINAAIMRFEFADYTLKVETSEIIESALRIIQALKELSIGLTKRGDLLLKCIILERSCKFQLWGDDDRYFMQMRILSKPTSDRLQSELNHSLLFNYSANQIQSALYCPKQEAELIL